MPFIHFQDARPLRLQLFSRAIRDTFVDFIPRNQRLMFCLLVGRRYVLGTASFDALPRFVRNLFGTFLDTFQILLAARILYLRRTRIRLSVEREGRFSAVHDEIGRHLAVVTGSIVMRPFHVGQVIDPRMLVLDKPLFERPNQLSVVPLTW